MDGPRDHLIILSEVSQTEKDGYHMMSHVESKISYKWTYLQIRKWKSENVRPPGSSVHGILQARILEWVVIPFSRGSSWPRDWTWISRIAGRFFTIWASSEELQIRKGVIDIENSYQKGERVEGRDKLAIWYEQLQTTTCKIDKQGPIV